MFKTELGRNILHKFTRWTLNFGSLHKYERKTAYVDHHVTTGWAVNDVIVAIMHLEKASFTVHTVATM